MIRGVSPVSTWKKPERSFARDMERAGANRSQSVAFVRHCRVNARLGASCRSPNQPLLSHASLTYFFRDMTVTRNILVFVTHNIMSLHLTTNHWFVEDSTNSYCSPVYEAKASTEKCSPISATLKDKIDSFLPASSLF